MSITPFRLRITHHGTRTYLVREEDKRRVYYRGADEMNLSLNALVADEAAELRFLLEDSATGGDAAAAVRNVLKKIYPDHVPGMPRVEVL